MITKPPPYDSAPTLAATHVNAPSPPPAAGRARTTRQSAARPGGARAPISPAPAPASPSATPELGEPPRLVLGLVAAGLVEIAVRTPPGRGANWPVASAPRSPPTRRRPARAPTT